MKCNLVAQAEMQLQVKFQLSIGNGIEAVLIPRRSLLKIVLKTVERSNFSVLGVFGIIFLVFDLEV